MKAVILCGGFGTRLHDPTQWKPKQMVMIGGRPIVWHIMKTYAHAGINEFVLLLGKGGEQFKQYFIDYSRTSSRITVDTDTGGFRAWGGDRHPEPWRVHLVDTGEETMTGGRVKRAGDLLQGEPFLLTYGDGVANVNVRGLIDFHRSHGKLATLTAVRPPSRFGDVALDGDAVTAFAEKRQSAEGWINGGYFVLEPRALDYIEGDAMPFEHAPLERLANEGQLMAYRHDGFWQCMDTPKDRDLLESLWQGDSPPWKVWSE